jgi:hypothetical protein
MPRIGTSVRASLRAAVRFEKSGLRLQKLSSANVTARENLAVSSMVEKHGNLMLWFNEQAQKGIKPRFLAEKFIVQYAASGRDLLRDSKPSQNNGVIVFANPDFQLNDSRDAGGGRQPKLAERSW